MFACVSTGLSAGGHAAAAGHDVAPAGLAAGFLTVLALAWSAAGRERGFAEILAAMLCSQLAFHLIFSVATPGTAAADAGGHHSHAVAAGPTEGMSPGMVAAHLAAAIISAGWLRRGEAAAFALVRRIATAVLTILRFPRATAAPIMGAPAPPPRGPARSARTDLLRHTLVQRGPPVRPAGY
ncbi:hypothetical protein GCM10009800_31270 [Nocardiopsis rhodophaea]